MLNFLGLSASSRQEASSGEKFDHLDESTQKKLFDYVAKQVVKTLGIEEAAKYVSFFLQKRYETVKPKEVFENINSFVVVFAKAVLEAVDYPNGTNKEEIYKLLQEYTEEKHRDLDATDLGQKIVRMFNNIPNPVITLFLPAYHSFLKNSKDLDKDKKIFREVFFDRFFNAPMLDAPEEPALTLDFKMGLLTNAKSLDPFKKMTIMLDEANKAFTQIQMNPQSVNTAKAIYESHFQFFQFIAKLNQVSGIFRILSETLNLEIQSDWGYIYSDVATKLEQLGQKLEGNAPNKTPEALKGLLMEGRETLEDTLKTVVKDPVDGFSRLPRLEEESRELQQRIYQLKTMLSNFEQLFKPASPAKTFYRSAFADCHHLFQTFITTLVHSIADVDNNQLWQEIEACQIKVSQIVARFINEPIEGLTPLHRLVMTSQVDQQDFQRQLEFLLRQGAEVKTTTTNYERKTSGRLATLFRSVLPASQPPLNAEQLADLFGNGAVLKQAEASIKAQENEDAQTSANILKDLASEVKSRTSSTASQGSFPPTDTSETSPAASDTIEESAPELAPPQIALSWQKGNKRERRQRTPETTPRNSGDNTEKASRKARRF